MVTSFSSLSRKIDTLKRHEEKVRVRLDQHFSWRLGVGVAIALSLFVQVLRTDNVALGFSVGFLVVFVWLIVRTQKLRRLFERMSGQRRFYERQLARWSGHFEGIDFSFQSPLPSSFQEIGVALARDLNLFGKSGLRELVDECFSARGVEELFRPGLELMLSEKDLLRSHKLIPELARKMGPLRRFVVEGQTAALTLRFRVDSLIALVKQPFLKNFDRFWLITQSILWITWLGPFLFGYHSLSAGLWILYAVFTFLYLLRTGSAFSKANALFIPLERLSIVFGHLEKTAKAFPLVLPRVAESPPSLSLRRLSRIVSFLSTETHPLVFMALNMLLPWTPWWTQVAEKRRLQLAKDLPGWLEEMASAERWASLTFLFRYQSHVFPEFTDQFSFEGLRHPLIARSTVVSNDFAFDGFRLALVTGSNMSGKSTFLRTVGLNQVLATMGAPVFARQFLTKRVPIHTCISVSDSLAEGLSYFYAEVKQLRFLLEQARSQKCLFLIDEIFRGTNNRERYLGAKALLLALLETPSFGLVSTHDLELAQLESSHAELRNFHFREEIENGDMSFTFLLRPGPSPTTNALEIMRREGLPIP